MNKLVSVLVALAPCMICQGQVNVDGLVEPVYGQPLAIDSTIPAPGEGGPSSASPLDLSRLYVTNDEEALYVALEIAGDVAIDSWAKYVILINSPQINGTTTGCVWPRADRSVSNFQVAFWADSGGGAEFKKWNQTSSSWADASGTFAIGNAKVPSILEARIPLTELGDPSTISIAAFSTGIETTNPALDAIPGENGNGNWTTPSALTKFATYRKAGSLTAPASAVFAEPARPDGTAAIAWQPDASAAFRKAKEMQRPLLVLFVRQGVDTCDAIVMELDGDPEVSRRIASETVPAKLDISLASNEHLIKKLSIVRVPCAILYGTDGRVIARNETARTKSDFLSLLSQINAVSTTQGASN